MNSQFYDKEYIIYCDESDRDGVFYSNFYGGLIVGASQLDRINEKLNKKKQELNLTQEIKWEKVTANYLEKYKDFISCFFEEVLHGHIRTRIMFIRSAYSIAEETKGERDEQYLKLYYQFLKHSFGLKFIETNAKVNIKFFLDKFPFDKGDRIEKFQDYISKLPQILKRHYLNIEVCNIVQIESKKHVLLQCVDIVLGSIQFMLNDKHKQKIEGSSKRGRRTIAKEKLYRHIFKHIRECTYQWFNIGESTKWTNDERSLWEDSHRHWDFKPSNSIHNPTLTKGTAKRNKKGPTFPT